MYSDCRPFTKTSRKLVSGDNDVSIQMNQAKPVFNIYTTYGAYKGVTKKSGSDKVLCDKAIAIASNPHFYGYQCGFHH